MVNVNKLKAKFVENNVTQRDVAKMLDLNEATLNRKINDMQGEYLKINEAKKLINILGIKNPEEIFFADCVS